MTRLTTLAAGVLLLGLATFGARGAFAADADSPLTLNDAVRNAVQSQLKGYKPAAAHIEISASEDVTVQTVKIANRSQRIFHARDSGLWAVTAQGTSSLGSGSGHGESLSLCGLITLLSAGHGAGDKDGAAAPEIDKLFVPFGLRSTADATQYQHVTSFTTDSGGICAPAPGGQFSYTVESRTVLNAKDAAGRIRALDGSYHDTCVVADETRPARTFDPALKGPALLVLCARQEKSGHRLTARFVFLTEMGLFLSLGEDSPEITRKTRYDKVDSGG